jgi:hypothetical protein
VSEEEKIKTAECLTLDLTDRRWQKHRPASNVTECVLAACQKKWLNTPKEGFVRLFLS